MATNGGLADYSDCALEVSVCSPDGEQYQISVIENCNGTRTFADTVGRSGENLPTVNFTGVCMVCDGYPFTCDLVIDGTLLPANQVRLAISGTCDDMRTFEEIQIVDLVLGGSCNPGPDGNPVGGV